MERKVVYFDKELKGNLVIANSPTTDISNAHELLTKWTIRAPNIKHVFSSQI